MEAVAIIDQVTSSLIGVFPNCEKAAEELAAELEPMASLWTVTSVETQKNLPLIEVIRLEGYDSVESFLTTYFEDCRIQKTLGLWDRYDLGITAWRYFINK